jgi:hypothetical protein
LSCFYLLIKSTPALACGQSISSPGRQNAP